jgi:poly(A)-specific ribonuclease
LAILSHKWLIFVDFKDLLPQMIEDINESCFISIDGEFTGLSSERNIHPYDTSEEYYQKTFNSTSKFILIQLGISLFKKSSDGSKVNVKSYNIFTYPRANCATFLCEGSSLSFLADHGFDFNKLFSKGISYCNEESEQKLREHVKERQEARADILQQRINDDLPEVSDRVFLPVPENEINLINDARTKVQSILDNKITEACFEKLNSFQRKLVYELLEREFYNKVSTISRTLDDKSKALVVTKKRTNEEEVEIEDRKIRDDETFLIESIGVRLILKAISESKKLIVGHNCLLDIMYLIQQCFQDVPEDYEEFKKLVHKIFPSIIDTKYIANSEKFKDIFSSSVLNQVYERLKQKPFLPVEIEWENQYQTYDLENGKEHEAAYDSFLTGYCFLVMLQYLKVPLEMKFEKRKELDTFLNRIALQRILTPFIYVVGNEPKVSKAHVFYIKFLPTWKSTEITNQFKNYGPVQISWINSTEAFVSLHNKENASCVIKTIVKSNGFEIMSYADFHEQEILAKSNKRKVVCNNNSPAAKKQKRLKNSFEEPNNW